MYRELPPLPTIAWRRGRWDSRTHYQGDDARRALCGARIPLDLYDLDEGDGEVCDRCARIYRLQHERGERARAAEQAARVRLEPEHIYPYGLTAADLERAHADETWTDEDYWGLAAAKEMAHG